MPTFEGAPWPQAGERGPQAVQQLVSGPNGSDTTDSVYEVAGTVALWPLSVMCRLTCSGAPGDRTVALEYRTPDDVRYLVAGTRAVVQAGVTQSFCWQPQAGGEVWPVEDAAIASLPQQHIYPGYKLAIKIGNGQAGDVLDRVLISARFDPIMLDEGE